MPQAHTTQTAQPAQQTAQQPAWYAIRQRTALASAADGSARTQYTTPMLGTAAQVVSMGWTASTISVGANNTEVSGARTGNCASGANVLRIGMYQGTAIPFGGNMSATVYCPTLPSAADRALIRRFVGSLQGQTL